MTDLPTAVSIKTAAGTLDVSPDTVRRMIAARQIPAAKIRGGWRIRVSDLDAYLARHTARR